MIDGITVLNNITVSNFNLIPWLGVLIGLLVAFIIIYIKYKGSNRLNDAMGLLCIMFIGLFVIFIVDIRFSKADAIQCTIEDYVTINEVYDKYDVIDKQGEIWTLREIEDEKA